MEIRYRFFMTKRGDIVDTRVLADASLVFHKNPVRSYVIDEWEFAKIRRMFPSIKREVTKTLTVEECLDRGDTLNAFKVYSNINNVGLVEAKNAVDKLRKERCGNLEDV